MTPQEFSDLADAAYTEGRAKPARYGYGVEFRRRTDFVGAWVPSLGAAGCCGHGAAVVGREIRIGPDGRHPSMMEVLGIPRELASEFEAGFDGDTEPLIESRKEWWEAGRRLAEKWLGPVRPRKAE